MTGGIRELLEEREAATLHPAATLARNSAGRAEPVLSVFPTPGEVDVVVASELMECGRAVQRGESLAPCSFRDAAVALNGFHGFHVPGASGSDRVCVNTDAAAARVRPATTTDRPKVREAPRVIMAEDCIRVRAA